MTILDKNTITLPNAQETYPNIVDSVNEGLFYYTIPITIMSIGVILFIAVSIKDRRGENIYTPILLIIFSVIFLAVASFTSIILIDKLEKDTNILAEHVSQHPETEDNITALANTTGFDYKDICDTIMDNRESSLCGGELFDYKDICDTIMDNRESSLCGGEVFDSITWGDNDDIYQIDPDYDYNDTEDELIVTFNLKEVTEEQS